MSNTNKDGIICPTAFSPHSVVYPRVEIGGQVKIGGLWDRTKNELILARFAPDATLDIDFEITSHISFFDVPIVDGIPVSAVLRDLSSKVESIVVRLEREAKRIGLV